MGDLNAPSGKRCAPTARPVKLWGFHVNPPQGENCSEGCGIEKKKMGPG